MLLALLSFCQGPLGAVLIQGADFSPIGRSINGAQVIQIGEATHGGAEFYTTKTELVKYLHEKEGFNVLVLESGAIETTLAMADRNARQPNQLMNDTVFGNFRWKESLPLFEFIKSKPKLRVVGIDCQFSSDAVVDLVVKAVKPHDAKLAEDINQHIGDGYKYFSQSNEPEKFNKARDAFVAWLDDAKGRLDAIADRSPELKVIVECWPGLRRFWSASALQVRNGQQFAMRDEVMAKNLIRMVGNEKAILWAHNGHIGKGLGYTITGDHLRRHYQSKTYALGIFAQKGEWYAHWDRKTYPYATPKDGLESQFGANGSIWFLDLKSNPKALSGPTQAYEPENGGVITFDAAARFDGVLVLPKSSIPSKVP